MAIGCNPANQYQAMQVRNADRMGLVILLYKGAIKEARLARQLLQTDQTGPRVRAINKTLAIIGELQACLDFENGGDIARSLDRLYGYMTRGLTMANLRRDPEGLEEIARLLENLLSGWEEAHAREVEDRSAADTPARPGSSIEDRLTLQSGSSQGLHLSY